MEEDNMPGFNPIMFLFGCIGGLLPDVLRLIRNRYTNKLEAYLKEGQFWIGVALLVAIGGLVAWILQAQTIKDALIFGFAAPELLSRLVSEAVKSGKTRGKVQFKLRQWWTE
jgi:hypothetical protein